jgi:protein TonB
MGTRNLSLRPFLVASLLLHLSLALLPAKRIVPEIRPFSLSGGPLPAPAGPDADLGLSNRGRIDVVDLFVLGEAEAEVGEPIPPEAPALIDDPVEVEPVPPRPARALPRLELPGALGASAGGPAGDAGGRGSGGDREERLVPPVVVAISWPEYPRGARRRSSIPIVLAVHVNPAGEVDAVRVEQGGECPVCDEAAIASAWQMRFLPATRGGRPVAAWTRVPVTFRRK